MAMTVLNELPESDSQDSESVGDLEMEVRRQLRGRINELRIQYTDEGLVLFGLAPSYHVKQLVQHVVMTLGCRPIAANRVEVEMAFRRRPR